MIRRIAVGINATVADGSTDRTTMRTTMKTMMMRQGTAVAPFAFMQTTAMNDPSNENKCAHQQLAAHKKYALVASRARKGGLIQPTTVYIR